MWRYISAGLLGAVIGWAISEPFQDDHSYWTDFYSLYAVSLGIIIGLTIEKFIFFKKYSRIRQTLKSIPIYIIPLLAVYIIKMLLAPSLSSESETNGITDEVTESRVLVLDRSSSMSGEPIEELKIAVFNYLDIMIQANSQDEIGCVTYDDDVEIISNLTTSYQNMKLNMNDIFTRGGTSILPGLTATYNMLSSSNYEKKDIILLSDGVIHDENAGLNLIQNNPNIPIYCVGLGKSYDKVFLQKAASLTGGSLFEATEINNLTNTFKEIAQRQIGATQVAHGEETISLPFLNRLLAWSLFGLMIGITIGWVDKKANTMLIGAIGGLIGGALSAILFVNINSFEASALIIRLVSFSLLGILIGFSIYWVKRLYSLLYTDNTPKFDLKNNN